MKKVNEDFERSGLTMTVAELIEALSVYPGDIPVLATWEGVCAGIRKDNFCILSHNGRDELQIDVENYG